MKLKSENGHVIDSAAERERGDEPSQSDSAQLPGKNEPVKIASTQPSSLPETKRLAYSIAESAQLLGVHYFSVYRMIQRGKLRACRVLRGKLLVPRTELLKLLNTE